MSKDRAYRFGIDVGGTFTDTIVLGRESGQVHYRKTPSSPSNPERAAVASIKALAESGNIQPGEVDYIVHGTTLALNTIVERRGTRTGLIVTKGFRDILELARGQITETPNFRSTPPEPLIPRQYVYEVSERCRADGEVVTPVDLEETISCATELADNGAESIAVCFMHAYKNPTHERIAVQELRRKFPDLYICASHEIWPQIREYERTMVSVVNAYVGGTMTRYYGRLGEGLRGLGIDSPVYITRSNGGIMTISEASRTPVSTLISGPAAGVTGGAYVARLASLEKVICFDMGGTTADVSVVEGEPRYALDTEIAGFPLSIPAIDVVSIGAGGGSIAWMDPETVLRVGPQSAGADPGPAAYDIGGTRPTLTDAYVALGYLDPASFLGGDMVLNPERSREVLSELGERTNETVSEVARQVVEVTNANMYAQLMGLLARHGLDPHEFTLLAYGGAGPTQAFFLAEDLGVPQVLIPPIPGGLCALGCLVAEFRIDFVAGLFQPIDRLKYDDLEKVLSLLETQAYDWVSAEGAETVHWLIEFSADMRYRGQSFEVNVPIGRTMHAKEIEKVFHQRHKTVYGHSDQTAPAEIMNVRAQLVGFVDKPDEVWLERAKNRSFEEQRFRDAWFDNELVKTPVYQRSALGIGTVVQGPAIIEQYDTSIVVPVPWSVRTSKSGNLIGVRI